MIRKIKKLGFLVTAVIIAILVGQFYDQNTPAPDSRRSVEKQLKNIFSPDTTSPKAEKEESAEIEPSEDAANVYPVERVVDGDTIVVRIDGERITLRLIGVDTPETVHPKKPVEYYGKEASRYLKNLLSGEKVQLEYDKGEKMEKDKYGRGLAYVYRHPDGLFINAEIIRQGYGHAYTQYPFKYMDKFRSYENQARKAKRGLWADK